MALLWQTIANLATDVTALVTKAIPSDEQRAAAFKIRSQWLYTRCQFHIMNKIVRECESRHFFSPVYDKDIALEVRFATANLPQSETDVLIPLVQDILKAK